MAARDRLSPRRNRAAPVVTLRNRPPQAAPAAGPGDAGDATDDGGGATTVDEVLALAERCRDALPAAFRRHAETVVITVRDFPDAETMAQMGCATRWDLLGLYSGIAVGDKQAGHAAPVPDRIFLYARPISAHARATGASLAAVVRHVLIHEIGHHFGLSDADMARIEAGVR